LMSFYAVLRRLIPKFFEMNLMLSPVS
jgi:hypothetical protein